MFEQSFNCASNSCYGSNKITVSMTFLGFSLLVSGLAGIKKILVMISWELLSWARFPSVDYAFKYQVYCQVLNFWFQFFFNKGLVFLSFLFTSSKLFIRQAHTPTPWPTTLAPERCTLSGAGVLSQNWTFSWNLKGPKLLGELSSRTGGKADCKV